MPEIPSQRSQTQDPKSEITSQSYKATDPKPKIPRNPSLCRAGINHNSWFFRESYRILLIPRERSAEAAAGPVCDDSGAHADCFSGTSTTSYTIPFSQREDSLRGVVSSLLENKTVFRFLGFWRLGFKLSKFAFHVFWKILISYPRFARYY